MAGRERAGSFSSGDGEMGMMEGQDDDFFDDLKNKQRYRRSERDERNVNEESKQDI